MAVCVDGPASSGGGGSVAAQVVCHYVPTTSQVVNARRPSHAVDIVVSLWALESTHQETPQSAKSTCWPRWAPLCLSVCVSVRRVLENTYFTGSLRCKLLRDPYCQTPCLCMCLSAERLSVRSTACSVASHVAYRPVSYVCRHWKFCRQAAKWLIITAEEKTAKEIRKTV